MFGNMNMGEMMKQAQQLQDKLKKAQEEQANKEYHGESGAGLVKVVMTGRYDLKNVDIDPQVLEEEKEMLEDLIAAAVNDAVRKVEKGMQMDMGNLAGMMGDLAGK